MGTGFFVKFLPQRFQLALRSAFAVVLIACWLIAASFMVVLSPPVTHFLAEATVQSEGSIHSHDYLVSIADATRSFSLGNDKASIPVGDDERTSFTPKVISHLLDVRTVFIGAIVFFAGVSLMLVLYVVFALCKPKQCGEQAHSSQQGLRPSRLGFELMVGGLVPLVLCVVLACVGALAFNVLFTWMHNIFFSAGTWTFSYDSLLIRALPTNFWMGCGLVWALALIAFCLASIGLGVLLKRRSSKIPPKDATKNAA